MPLNDSEKTQAQHPEETPKPTTARAQPPQTRSIAEEIQARRAEEAAQLAAAVANLDPSNKIAAAAKLIEAAAQDHSSKIAAAVANLDPSNKITAAAKFVEAAALDHSNKLAEVAAAMARPNEVAAALDRSSKMAAAVAGLDQSNRIAEVAAAMARPNAVAAALEHSNQMAEVAAALIQPRQPDFYPEVMAPFETRQEQQLAEIIDRLENIDASLKQLVEILSQAPKQAADVQNER